MGGLPPLSFFFRVLFCLNCSAFFLSRACFCANGNFGSIEYSRRFTILLIDWRFEVVWVICEDGFGSWVLFYAMVMVFGEFGELGASDFEAMFS